MEGENRAMWKRVGVVVMWILATFGTASITLAAVSRVGGEVSDRPAVPVAGTDLAATSRSQETVVTTDPTASATTQPVVEAAASSSLLEGSSPSTTVPATDLSTTMTSDITSDAGPGTGSESASSSSTTSTTSTTVATTTYLDTTGLLGGTVTVQVTGNGVVLIAAIPNDGFTAEVKKSAPSKVEVEFNSPGHDSRYQAEVRDGFLDVDIEEHEEDGEEEEDDD